MDSIGDRPLNLNQGPLTWVSSRHKNDISGSIQLSKLPYHANMRILDLDELHNGSWRHWDETCNLAVATPSTNL
ncbi:hypothetical protein TNCV_4136481 [Trichonephila clavipes]|nr:hypothetical protein TNCV_4136481 [Trichonephila clavipes]